MPSTTPADVLARRRQLMLDGDADGLADLFAPDAVIEFSFHGPPGTPVRVVVRGPAELAVEDEGPGIPETQAGAVFERFTRLEGALASGSGLGLAIASELADLMGGSIRLESAPERTVFALLLPATARDRVPA